MRRLRKLLKLEMDVELLSCAHTVSMICFYGIVMWIAGERNVRILVLFEMMALGYVSAWTQRALFLREQVYSRTEYAVCEVLWNVMPAVFVPAVAEVFGWFRGTPDWAALTFYLLMGGYYVLVWLFLRFVNYEETVKMNRQLRRRKEKGQKKGKEQT